MRSSEFLREADLANPYTGKDPVKAAAWAKLSPQVQQKLGGADPTDPFIIARMTKGELGGVFGGGVTDANPDGTRKAQLSGLTAVSQPAAAAAVSTPAAAAPAAPAAVPTPVKPATALTGAPLPPAAPVKPAATAAPAVATSVNALGQNITMPDGTNSETGAVTTPTTGAQAASAPVKTGPVADPKILALQQQLIAAGAKIKADGVMGSATTAAQKQFGGNVTDANQSAAETARLRRQNATAATATANQSPAETARLAKAGTVPARPGVMSTSTQMAAWDRNYARTHNADGTPKAAVRESSFEHSVSRMRSLSTLLKG